MSGLYYVFLKWTPANHVQTAREGRYMLLFPSRHVADSLFRALQSVPRSTTVPALMFPVLTRPSAQFWTYDSPEGWAAIFAFQDRNLLPEFRDRFSTLLLHDGASREWPTIPHREMGPDWLSGRTFFVRSRRERDVYWTAENGRVRATTDVLRRTKFRITRVGEEGEGPIREPVVLTKGDRVRVEVVPETVRGGGTEAGFVGVDEGNGMLVVKGRAREWGFGELVNGDVGVTWGLVGGSDTAFVAHLGNDAADEWELV